MTVHRMISVYDTKMETFSRPVFVPTIGVAIRSFSDECKKDGDLKAHPDDFILHELGHFDDINGQVECFAIPKRLLSAREAVGV